MTKDDKISLPCPDDACGWKTVKVEQWLAKELLDQHIQVKHHSSGAVTEVWCKPERMIRPKASLDMSETTWRDFTGQ